MSISSADADRLRAQFEFYFSDANLQRDAFLRDRVAENEHGFVPLSTFVSFRRVAAITTDVNAIFDVLKESTALVVDEEARAVRRALSGDQPVAGACQQADGMQHGAKKNVLLLVTGSVAAIKTYELAHLLQHEYGHNVKIVATTHAQHFISTIPSKEQERYNKATTDCDDNSETTSNGFEILTDEHEWNSWTKRGDPVVHIDLRKWADVAVIAPLDANTLAKLSNGMCDNLLTCVMRAWPCGAKPVVVAPAMNEAMWEHPLTRPQMETLRNIYEAPSPNSEEKEKEMMNKKVMYEQVGPVRKLLMCGEYGVGAMASPADIAEAVKRCL